MELIVYLLLILTSVVGLTFIIERAFALRWGRVMPREVEAAVQSCQTPEDVPMLRRVCQQHNSVMSRLLLTAAEHLDWPKAEAVDAIQTRARHEIVRLERGLVVLEIIVGLRRCRTNRLNRRGQTGPRHCLDLAGDTVRSDDRHSIADFLELLHQEGRTLCRRNGNRLR